MATSKIALTHTYRPSELPSGSRPPVVILLHGWGSNEANMMSLADYIDERYVVAGLRGPIELSYGSYGWYYLMGEPGRLRQDDADALRARDLVLRSIGEVVAEYDANPAKVVLMGFSQGAIISLGAALHSPDAVAGVIAMSGYLLPAYTADREVSADLGSLPILATHGLWDQIIPVENGRGVRDYFAGKPAAFTYKEYPMAHEVSAQSLLNIEAWLKERLA